MLSKSSNITYKHIITKSKDLGEVEVRLYWRRRINVGRIASNLRKEDNLLVIFISICRKTLCNINM